MMLTMFYNYIKKTQKMCPINHRFIYLYGTIVLYTENTVPENKPC